MSDGAPGEPEDDPLSLISSTHTLHFKSEAMTEVVIQEGFLKKRKDGINTIDVLFHYFSTLIISKGWMCVDQNKAIYLI